MLPVLNSHYSITKEWVIINTETGLIMKSRIVNGYKVITLTILKKRKTYYIHRLLAFAYIPNPDNKPHINHKDKNRLNNDLDNLEWVTQSENNKHSWIWRVQSTNQKIASSINWRNNWITVYQFSKQWILIAQYNSTREASKITNIAHTSIWYVCNWKRKTAGKFTWSYILNP